MKTLNFLILAGLAAAVVSSRGAEANSEEREREVRGRYETVLLRNPFQERAFNQVYESYLKYEGIDAWLTKLATATEGDNSLGALLLQGQIYDRQFKSAEAVAAFEKAAEKGEKRASFKVLLGTLYYKIGNDEKATVLLSTALDDLADLDQRSSVCRMLGNLYLRQGKRDNAIAVWKRIAELNPNEIFSQLELAEIYEDNRMWDEAIAVYRRIADLSREDAYRKCRALRSIGQCLIQAEKFKEAIVTLEQALELVAPGNWLFEDIKLRLVSVYEDIGDLEGLTKYLLAKLEQSPGDVEFRDLLAETYTRMAKFDLAEKEYLVMLERNPRSSTIREKLISLYVRTEKKDQLAATYEKLIELFPSDHEYLRRLGESYLRDNQPVKAKETWQRLVKDQGTPERLAELAGWYEGAEFPDEAAAAYEKAIQGKKNKDWTFRLAALKFQKGEETNAVNLWLSVIDPASAKAEEFAEVANILEVHQKAREAGPLRAKAVEKAPDNLEYHLAHARNLMVRQKFEEGLAEFETLAGQSTNEYFTAQGETGRLDAFRELGILEQKQKEWEKELDASPNSAQLLGKLARLYERAGQREKAIQLYERRRAAEPDNLDFARALAGVYKSAKQIEQAVALLNTLVEKDKNRARVYYKDLMDIYLGVDLREEAIAAAEKIVSLAPSDPEARLSLAQVYAMYQQPEKALQEYRAVLRLEANEPDYYRQYGEALSAEKRWGEAQEAFRKMLDTSREDATRLAAVSSLARIYLQQERIDDLVGEFNRRVRNTPKKMAAYEELAAIYKEAGLVQKSVETLESGLQLVDDKEPALKSLIRATYEAQDFPKVRTYFEQLVASSGKPSPFELERLGSIYAQMGEVEKAKETWAKIVQINPKDAKLANQYADILKREGFSDEAVVAKARAIELDPFNYKQRYDYAQTLANAQQFVQALEELRKLLDLGDHEEKKKEESSEKKVDRLARTQNRGPVNAYQFMYGMRSGGGRYFGGGWQGGYKDFRPNVVMLMASLARQSIGEDNFIKEFQDQIAKDKDNTERKRDLIAIYQMYNRAEDALKLAEELIKTASDDVDLLQQLALYYATQQQPEKAIPLLEKLAASQPKFRMQAVQGLVPLYFQSKQEEKALALVDEVIKENPSDMTVIYSMGSLMQNQGKFEKARVVYRMAEKADPRYRQNTFTSIANSYKQEGKLPEALAIYKELLLAPEPNFGGYLPNRRQAQIYVPAPATGQNRVFYGGGALGNFPQNIMGSIDYAKSQALMELKQAGGSGAGDTNAWAEYEKIALSYRKSAPQSERIQAWNASKLLAAFYMTEQHWDKATQLLKNARDNGMEDVEWFNLSVYMAEQREQHDRMVVLYDELQQKYPGRSREITAAKATTWIMARKYAEAATIIRQMNQERVPPAQITGMIQPLIAAGEKKLARELLEQHLETSSRNSQALAMLANLYAEENESAKAIALANESWKRQVQGRANTSWMYSYSYGYYGPSYSGPNQLLRDLHRYYVAAGKSSELIAEFKDRLEKQPGSVQAHENLAELYRYNNEREKAIEIYEALAQKRPHLQQTRKTIAGLYSEKGDFKRATAIYEQLLKDYPAFYQQLSWELRDLYQRIGKGKDLAKIEQNMAQKARDPNQLRQMADRFRQTEEFDKAAEIYEKIVKTSPQDTYAKSQLADIYVQLGKVDDAVKLYREHLESPMRRAQGSADSYTLQKIAGLYNATGQLQELKDYADAELKKNPSDMNAKCLKAHIAIMEKRFPEALDYYEEASKQGRDPNALYQLMQLAEVTGDVARILKIVDSNPNQQQYWDLQRVAQFFQAQGNEEKARAYMRKWTDQRIQNGGGWEYSEVLRTLLQAKFVDLAEEFAGKHRRENMEDYYKQEFDRAVVAAYVSEGRFTNVIESVLTKDNLAGRDLELLRELTRHYRDKNDPVRRKEILEKVVANDPKNRELAFDLADVYSSEKQYQRSGEILVKLVAEDPNNQGYRERYTDALIRSGRGAEGLKLLDTWVREKPSEQRYQLLSTTQKRLGFLKGARASLVKAQEIADPSRKLDCGILIARFDAEQGDVQAEKSALLEKFKTRKDAGAFSEYLGFLKNSGRDGEAYDFFIAEKDSYLDRYRGNDFLDLCVGRGDMKTPLEINWQFVRYTDRWNRDYFFRPVSEFYQNHGKSALLLADLKSRIDAETKPGKQLLLRLGQTYQECGYPEKAVEVYQRLMVENPYDEETPIVLAELLGKLKRPDEAIQALQNRKQPSSLQGEINQKIQLIRVYFQNDRSELAEKEIKELVSWAKGGQTLGQIGNLYFERKNYEKAVKLFEESDRLYRGYNRDEMLSQMARCYAKTKQPDKVQSTIDQLGASENTGTVDNLAGWCVQEGEFDLAIKLYESKLRKSPGNVEIWFQLAQAQQKAGNTDSAFSTLSRGVAAIPHSSADQYSKRAGGFLQNSKLTEAALLRLERNPEPWLVDATLYALGNAPAEKEKSKALADRLQKSKTDNLDARLAAATSFAALELKEAATAWFESVLASEASEEKKMQAAAGLANVDASAKAQTFLAAQLEARPYAILNDPVLIKAIVKTGDSSLIAKLRMAATNMAFNESQEKYYSLLIASDSGEKEKAVAFARELIAHGTLNAGQLQSINAILKEEKQSAERQQALERIAAGGYGYSQKYEALSELAGLYALDAGMDRAVAAYADLFPQWTMNKSAKALFAIAAAVTPEKLPALRKAILRNVADHPNRDANSQLIGLLAEIAAQAGQSESISLLCAEAKVEGLEKAEAEAWSTLIQDWELAGPFPFESQSDLFEPETACLKKQSSTSKWTKLDPKDVLGIVFVQPALGLRDEELAQKVVYARTEIESASDKEVIFCAGSDDWLKVWVNGEEVHSSPRNRGIALDQERFRVPLKKGKNSVLLKVGNASESWSFCLRLAPESGAPLVTAAK